MKFKPVPIMITLAAAFISCLVSILQRVDFSVFVFRLLITVVIFLVLGTIIKIVLENAFKIMEEDSEENVIESADEDQDEEQND